MAVREACRRPVLVWQYLLESCRLLWLRAWLEAAPAHTAAETGRQDCTDTTDQPEGTGRTDGTGLTGGGEAGPGPPGWLLRLPLPRTAADSTESSGRPGSELLLDLLARSDTTRAAADGSQTAHASHQ